MENKLEHRIIKAVNTEIEKEYETIKSEGKIIQGIEGLCRQLRFTAPELAEYARKRMTELASEKGDLP